jgi:prepilin-type N-terminal cleavage/methylation domain-containing protein
MRKRGFTLIELMIVIAIIAIIAAIAIPGLLAAQRASNERSASSSLKTLSTAETDFKTNDRDGDRLGAFWVRDVYGLYALCPSTNGSAMASGTDLVPERMLRLIDVSLAAGDGNVGASLPGCVPVASAIPTLSPKASYVYRHFASYDTATGSVAFGNVGNIAALGASFNNAKYGFMAFPVSYTSGHQVFINNEDITVWRADVGSSYSASFTAGGTSSSSWSGNVGGTAVTETLSWPFAPGGTGWGKLD